MSKFLNELDANRLLSSYDISMAKSFLCKTVDDAINYAHLLKFPIVMKILSSDIIHKTEAGCICVDIDSEEKIKEKFQLIVQNAKEYNPKAEIEGILIQEMAEEGFELIIGMKIDPQFGPVVMVGTGGIYVEIFNDVALRLLPITRCEAEEMLKETKAYSIINGARGKRYDVEEIINILLKISKLVQENNSIEEIDINPFFLYEMGKGGKGVDAVIKCK